MKLKIAKSTFIGINAVTEDLVPKDAMREFRYERGDDMVCEFDTDRFTPAFLSVLFDYLGNNPQEPNAKAIRTQLSVLERVRSAPSTVIVKRLDQLEIALKEYISRDAINFWLFRLDKEEDTSFAYLVTGIKYFPHDPRTETPAHTVLSLIHNSRGENRKMSFHFGMDDLTGVTIPQLLDKKGLYKESPELVAAYEAQMEQYAKYQPMKSEQFLATGYCSPFQYSRGEACYMGREGQPSKVVNDEAIVKREKSSTLMELKIWAGNDSDSDTESEDIRQFQIPTHPYIAVFCLERHENFWCHSNNLTPYVYNPKLKEKLVLPDDTSDLIDILTEDMDVLMEDIIQGKTGGTVVLARGGPGTGKTLTAEVYAEVIKRPLYMIQSSQLGLDVETLEKNLKEALKRATRWKACLLIDECDVYLRARSTDIQQNAIVGVFLRTLEYYSGLLFLTTNMFKEDGSTLAIDDAIISRASAVIDYTVPTKENSIKIFKILSKSFNLEVSDSIIEQCVDKWPKISGRSIKNLLKLTAKYCKKKEKVFALEHFVHCAQYLPIEGK